MNAHYVRDRISDLLAPAHLQAAEVEAYCLHVGATAGEYAGSEVIAPHPRYGQRS
jgi:hypothetical protein